METELVVEHTIVSLPQVSGMVLDVGCRAFDFSLAMVSKGYHVVCIDADDTVSPPKNPKIEFGNFALIPATCQGPQSLVKFGNGTGNYLEGVGSKTRPADSTVSKVEGASLIDIGSMFEVPLWDVVKLDCEGAEYDVLCEWPGPVSIQITVEFHEHTGANRKGDEIYTTIQDRLRRWYRVVQHEKSLRHGIGVSNYWDSLFVLNDEYLKGMI